MRITKILETSAPMRSSRSNAVIDFSEMTISIIAVFTDVIEGIRSSNHLGIGMISTTKMNMMPKANKMSPWRSTAVRRVNAPSCGIAVVLSSATGIDAGTG